MKVALIKKKVIEDFIREAEKRWEVYVPLADFSGDVHFARLNRNEKESVRARLKMDYQRMVIPPKAALFPQLESLFQFLPGRIVPTVRAATPRLFFGLRACDLKGILFVDDFFRRNFEDAYYLSRSAKRLGVVVGCRQPAVDCFCTSTRTGPFLKSGFDLQMVDLDDAYLVEVGSESGEALINKYRDFFEEAPKPAIERGEAEKRRAAENVSLKVDFDQAIRKVVEDKVVKEIYEKIAERCVYCGGCLYVCPTCTCFNVFDDAREGEGGRYRNWDACVFAGYTREAGGRNPRREKWVRAARRYEHKLKYDYLATGMSGCVGCGRCLSSCPVGIGISKFIQEITEGKEMI